MYTGIIEAVGTLARIIRHGQGAAVFVAAPPSFDCAHRVRIGDSVAANGVCLTATMVEADGFAADASAETLSLTCFKYYSAGEKLNLELPCTPATHLGGHIVQGHVDGIGQVLSLSPRSEALDIWVQAPAELMRYIAHKGSIAVDGMSLTVNEVSDERRAFRLTVIPHTQQVTNLSQFQPGRRVNLEVDVLARYIERLLTVPASAQAKEQETASSGSGLSLETLLANGF